jgi:prepilin-type N-terminal cleavage/methylation domain-containing protein
MKKSCYFKKGFTLTELLTVIGIIMILVLLAATGVRKAYNHSQKLRCVANLKNLYTISLLYFQDYKALPTTPDAVQTIQIIAKDQAKDMVCPAIRGSSPTLLLISETLMPINKLHMFMDFPEAPGKHPNYPLFSDTDIQNAHLHDTTPPHNGVGYAVLTSGKIIEFTMTDIDADPYKYLVTVLGENERKKKL